MTGPKFTKGPWIKCSRDETLIGSNGKSVMVYNCGLSTGGGKLPESVANARLIASATDGFALGELVMKMCDHREGLSVSESDILYKAASSFIKKCIGE